MRELFGTDGIRGVAGQFPLDSRTVHAIGRSLGSRFWRAGERPKIVLGMDTRESSPWIAAQLAGGLAAEGADVHFCGLITTPGIAYLTRTNTYAAGVVVSASHNLYQDNGIKVFDPSGYKLADRLEHELERDIFRIVEGGLAAAPAEIPEDLELHRAYVDYLAATFPGSLEGITIAVDCANGAASAVGPELFERLGATVHKLFCAPDGRNINLNCGALHVDALTRETPARHADIGLALDGDGDRAIFVSRTGKVLDGDAVLLIAARFLKERNRLPGPNGKPLVVATLMSNLGLEKALGGHGIALARTAVGDKYVLEEMLRTGAALGGEQSGHVIFREHATTGDGLLTALRVLEAMQDSGQDLEELARGLEAYPQRLVNVPVRQRRPLESLPEVSAEIDAARRALGDSGRILVRYSGTELLARVMVEGPDARQVDEHAIRIAAAIQGALGS